MTNIYVGNLPFSMTEQDLEGIFAPHGAVSRVSMVMDRETNRPRGFAFVEMTNDIEAEAAIKALDGTDIGSRKVVVNVAKPRENAGAGRGPRAGAGSYGGGGGYGGGRDGGFGGGRGGRGRSDY